MLVAMVAMAGVSVNAATLLNEDFDTFTGTVSDGAQTDTGLDLAHSGDVTGWSKSGAGTMHAVDLGSSDWAIMLFRKKLKGSKKLKEKKLKGSECAGINRIGIENESILRKKFSQLLRP